MSHDIEKCIMNIIPYNSRLLLYVNFKILYPLFSYLRRNNHLNPFFFFVIFLKSKKIITSLKYIPGKIYHRNMRTHITPIGSSLLDKRLFTEKSTSL